MTIGLSKLLVNCCFHKAACTKFNLNGGAAPSGHPLSSRFAFKCKHSQKEKKSNQAVDAFVSPVAVR